MDTKLLLVFIFTAFPNLFDTTSGVPLKKPSLKAGIWKKILVYPTKDNSICWDWVNQIKAETKINLVREVKQKIVEKCIKKVRVLKEKPDAAIYQVMGPVSLFGLHSWDTKVGEVELPNITDKDLKEYKEMKRNDQKKKREERKRKKEETRRKEK